MLQFASSLNDTSASHYESMHSFLFSIARNLSVAMPFKFLQLAQTCRDPSFSREKYQTSSFWVGQMDYCHFQRLIGRFVMNFTGLPKRICMGRRALVRFPMLHSIRHWANLGTIAQREKLCHHLVTFLQCVSTFSIIFKLRYCKYRLGPSSELYSLGLFIKVLQYESVA